MRKDFTLPTLVAPIQTCLLLLTRETATAGKTEEDQDLRTEMICFERGEPESQPGASGQRGGPIIQEAGVASLRELVRHRQPGHTSSCPQPGSWAWFGSVTRITSATRSQATEPSQPDSVPRERCLRPPQTLYPAQRLPMVTPAAPTSHWPGDVYF